MDQENKTTHWGENPQGWMYDNDKRIAGGIGVKQRYKMKRIRPKKPRKKIKI